MIRSANHSGYPRVGDLPTEREVRRVERERAAGRGDASEHRDVLDTHAAICVAEQARAFVDVVTDGLIRWDGLLARWAAHLDGVEVGEPFRRDAAPPLDRRPRVVGEVSWPGPMLAHDYLVAADVAAHRPVKVVLPGPVATARACRGDAGDADDRAAGFARACALEIAALAEAGCTTFQIDERGLVGRPDDAGLVAALLGPAVEAAGEGATVIVDLGAGDATPLAGALVRIPGTHLGLDARGAGLEAVGGLPEGRGVQLGLFDAGSAVVEDAADVAARLAPHAAALRDRDVLVAPHASLEGLPRDLAFDKLLQARYLAEALSRDDTWRS